MQINPSRHSISFPFHRRKGAPLAAAGRLLIVGAWYGGFRWTAVDWQRGCVTELRSPAGNVRRRRWCSSVAIFSEGLAWLRIGEEEFGAWSWTASSTSISDLACSGMGVVFRLGKREDGVATV